MRSRLKRALVPAVQVGMQACWLYAWLALIEAKVIATDVIAPVAVLFLAAAAFARASLDRLPLRPVLRITSFWLMWLLISALAGKALLYPAMAWGQLDWVFALPRSFILVIFETQPAELLLLLGSGCAWYFGGRAVSRRPTYESLLGQFQFGLVMLLGAFLLAHGLDVPIGHSVLLALAFFLLSLTGIAVTRSLQAGATTPQPGNHQFTGSLVTMLVTVGVLGLIAGVAITPGLIEILIEAGRFVLHTLQTAFLFIISLLPQPDITPPEGELPPPATGDDAGLLEFYRTLPWPALLRRVMFIVWVIVVMGMFLFALWRLCSMVLDWLKRRSDMAGIEVESLDSGFLADLRALLRWLERKARLVVQHVARFSRMKLGASDEPTWSSIYVNLVRWAGKKLTPREPSQSAHEYQAVLSELAPAAAPDLAFVTETYARARYGGHEPDSHLLQEMQAAVHRIRTAPRRHHTSSTSTISEGAE